MVVYVGNLPFDTTDDELAGLFARFGVVASARVAVDRATGRPHGFGYVAMAAGAADAIGAVNGAVYRGWTLVAGEAGPPQVGWAPAPAERPRAVVGTPNWRPPIGKKAVAVKTVPPPPEDRRREVFLALVEAQDRKATVSDSRRVVARKFALSDAVVRAIEAEGLAKDWPPL